MSHPALQWPEGRDPEPTRGVWQNRNRTRCLLVSGVSPQSPPAPSPSDSAGLGHQNFVTQHCTHDRHPFCTETIQRTRLTSLPQALERRGGFVTGRAARGHVAAVWSHVRFLAGAPHPRRTRVRARHLSAHRAGPAAPGRDNLVSIAGRPHAPPPHFSLITIKGSNSIKHKSCLSEHEKIKGRTWGTAVGTLPTGPWDATGGGGGAQPRGDKNLIPHPAAGRCLTAAPGEQNCVPHAVPTGPMLWQPPPHSRPSLGLTQG